MLRDRMSHKGENGKVAIIGGSKRMHGAPILTALAAEATGVDLLYLCVPQCHSQVAKQSSLNFQVFPFSGDEIDRSDTEAILELLATIDVAVIGPGIAYQTECLSALSELIASATCQLVLDATALQEDTLLNVRDRSAVLTPHLGELERMGIAPEQIANLAKETGATILLKGATDTVYPPHDGKRAIEGGNAGLTVGGTGDSLAGIIAGLIAQGMSNLDACSAASQLLKRVATTLGHRYGYSYSARQLIDEIPAQLQVLSVS